MKRPYDLVVIGGGSAGFNAARVAADLGKKVAIVDGARKLSGLCILKGCMPSKTLLYSAEVLHRAKQGKTFGLRIPNARADMRKLQDRKRRIIKEFADHRTRQLVTGKFELFRSNARFVDSHTVELSDGSFISGRQFLVATGSRVSVPPIPGLKEANLWTSDEVLDLDFLPKSVVVLGGGVVACELAQYLHRVGTRVTIIQRSDHLLKSNSPEASTVLETAFRKEGIRVLTGTQIKAVSRDKTGVKVHLLHKGKRRVLRAEHGFNALGREAVTAGLGLEAAGVKLKSNGQIAINRWQQSSAPHIYAAGDCSGPVEIVHVAILQGELAARHSAGLKKLKPVDFDLLLSVIFTDPGIASIGLTHAELVKRKVKFISAEYPFDDHGKSILMEAKQGYVKVFAAPGKGRLLGAEIVGPDAGELIHSFSGPLAMKGTVYDLLRAPWYHPTLSEIITYPLEEIRDRLARKKRA